MPTDLTLAAGCSAHLRLGEALTISLGPDCVYTLDRSGRLIGAFRQGQNLRRGLDGRVLARWRLGRGPRQRAWLSEAEIADLFAGLRRDLAALLAATPPPALAAALQRGLAFDPAADVAHFHQVYRPIPILPPDQYQALVLQATEGCSFNTCTFCALYRDRPFRVKTPAAFAQHIAAVRAFFGEGLRLRRSIFLADANALILPQARLLPLCDALGRAFTVMPADLSPAARRRWLEAHPQGVTGVYAFIDGFSAERKSAAEFAELARRGLRRVYIGLESGHEPLLAWLRKPSTAARMIEGVREMKGAGLQVGVIVLTGIGGARFDAGHRRDTTAALNAMPLDGEDILYFSPFQPDPGSPYEALAAAEGIDLPTPAFSAAQEQAIRSSLTLPPPPAGPKRVPYNLRDFVY